MDSIIHRSLIIFTMRLFCFPYAGGGASIYARWKNEFSGQIQLVAVQLPGRENRLFEPAQTRLQNLIPILINELQPHFESPFAFFGHSMGALIAFEITRELRRLERPLPSHLFLSAHRAPQLPSSKPSFHNLPDNDFIQRLRDLNGTPNEVFEDRELMDLLLPIMRADFELCETYEYRAEDSLDIPMIIYGGSNDPEVSNEELNAWRIHSHQPVQIEVLEGGHFFPFDARHKLPDRISKILAP